MAIFLPTWTDELCQRLTQLWATGASASAIGRQLGVSKNAVVGKARRMNLAVRPSPIRRRSAEPVNHERILEGARHLMATTSLYLPDAAAQLGVGETTLKRVLKKAGQSWLPLPRPIKITVRPPRPAAPPPDAAPVNMPSQRLYRPMTECQFIAGDPAIDATVCGAEPRPGSPYCPAHHARCYVAGSSQADERRKRRAEVAAQSVRLAA